MIDQHRWAALLEGWLALPGPRYARLGEALRKAIREGRLGARDPLPPERTLAALVGVSRTTVVAAYDALAAEGWIERRQGSGTRVAAAAPRRHRVLTLRTPAGGVAGDLDFTIAVPLLDDDQRAELASFGPDAFADAAYHPLGLPALRDALAARYCAEGLPTRPDQILVTTGAQQGISLAIAAFLRPRDACLIESPTFFGAIDALRAAGARLVGVPVGEEGVDPGQFASLLTARQPRLAFLTPTFQNPTGTVLSREARGQVGAALVRTGVPLIEDDSLVDLSFGLVPPPRIAAAAPDAHVISIGSLSKLYWAGLRVGWMRVPDDLVPRLVQTKTLADFGSSIPSQQLAVRVIESLDRHIAHRREAALPARDLLVGLLRHRLPVAEFRVPDGGQFLWVKLPTRNATGYTQVAAAHGVRVFPGAAMGVLPLEDSWLRLPFTLPVAVLPEAVDRMAAAWAEFASGDVRPRIATTNARRRN